MSNYKPSNYNIWECENLFYLKSHPSRINKLIAHYELYKKIFKLPGCIIECGVFKGTSLIRWAHFRNFLEKNQSRNIYGFDVFGSFPDEGVKSRKDRKFIKKYDAERGGVGINEKTLKKFIKNKKISNVHLLKGNVLHTTSQFIEKKKNLKIALLHLDLDVYEPTLHALKVFSKRVVKGGIILIDDYDLIEGATRATKDFLKGKKLKVQKISNHSTQVYIKI